MTERLGCGASLCDHLAMRCRYCGCGLLGMGESANTGLTVVGNPVSLAFTDTTVVTIDGTGQVYSTSLVGQTTSKLARIPVGTAAIAADIALSPDGTRLAVADGSGNIDLLTLSYSAITGEQALHRPGTAAGNAGESLAFSSDGQQLAAANLNGTIDLWDLHTGPLEGTLS